MGINGREAVKKYYSWDVIGPEWIKVFEKLGEEYSKYGFEEHKGYGTKKHFKAIRKHGLLQLHRKTCIHL